MANRYETMLDDQFEHGFAVDWMRKDLGICLDASDEVGASLPVTALVDQFYKDVQKLRWRALGYVKFDQAFARDGLGRMGCCPVYLDEHPEVF